MSQLQTKFETLEEFDNYSLSLSKKLRSIPLNKLRAEMAKAEGFNSYQSIKDHYHSKNKEGYEFENSLFSFDFLSILSDKDRLDKYLLECSSSLKYRSLIEPYHLALKSLQANSELSVSPYDFASFGILKGKPILKNGFFSSKHARESFKRQLTFSPGLSFSDIEHYKLLSTQIMLEIKKANPQADLKAIYNKVRFRHCYYQTFAMGLLEEARGHGVKGLDFRWIKSIDCVTFYALNSLGRKVSFVQSAGVYEAYHLEKSKGHYLLELDETYHFDNCLYGLKEALKEKITIKEKIIKFFS